MDEIEKTYLVKFLPNDLAKAPSREIADIYLPKGSPHAAIRIRKNGEKYEFTKKRPAAAGDASHLIEETIKLSAEEFAAFETVDGMKVRKIRYNYPYNDKIIEIDVFCDDLSGLVLADIEFDSKKEMADFPMPDFCLVDVTQEEFVAGGKLCGKKYDDIKNQLNQFSYKKIIQ